MELIKECWFGPGEVIVVIRTEAFRSTMAHLLSLYAEALRDFPSLPLQDASVLYYGGTYGIQFVPTESVPGTYRSAPELAHRYDRSRA